MLGGGSWVAYCLSLKPGSKNQTTIHEPGFRFRETLPLSVVIKFSRWEGDIGCRIWGLGLRARGLGFGVLGLFFELANAEPYRLLHCHAPQ